MAVSVDFKMNYDDLYRTFVSIGILLFLVAYFSAISFAVLNTNASPVMYIILPLWSLVLSVGIVLFVIGIYGWAKNRKTYDHTPLIPEKIVELDLRLKQLEQAQIQRFYPVEKREGDNIQKEDVYV